MSDSAPTIARYAPAPRPATDAASAASGEDHPWQDHGWSLGGGDVAALVGGLLIASYLVQWLVG